MFVYFLVDSEGCSSGTEHLSWFLTQRLLARKENVRGFFGAIKASLRAHFPQEAPFHLCYFLLLFSLFLGATLIPHNTPEIEALKKNERILTGSNFSTTDEK